MRARFLEISRRLEHVLVENRQFDECIARYSSPQTLFYCDPPYIDFQPNGRYQPFGAKEVRRLAAALLSGRHSFVISMEYSRDFIRAFQRPDRQLFVYEIPTKYSLASGSVVKRQVVTREILLSNVKL